MDTIARPFGILMMWLYDLTHNYLLAVILFTVIVKVILLPFMMKSKKGMMKRQLLIPAQKELEKRHGANKQKYQEELMKLYQEEHVNPMGGCLWSLLPFPILIALYGAIRKPLTVMMGVAKEQLAEGGRLLAELAKYGHTYSARDGFAEIKAAQFIHDNWANFSGLGIEKLRDVNYMAFGLDLGAQPSFKIWEWDWSSPAVWGPMLGLFCIPLLATFFTWLPTKITTKLNAQMLKTAGIEQDPKTDPNNNAMMMALFPLMTLVFCFGMPAALGFYWIANSVFSMVQDIWLTKHYTKTLAADSAARFKERQRREAELEAKRAETERLRAENGTSENASTSKKRQQNRKKKEQSDKDLAWQRANNPEEPAYEPSRVGTRRYARGRAYDPDRFSASGVEGATDSASSIDEELTEDVEERLELAAHPEDAEAVEDADDEIIDEKSDGQE